MLGERHRIIANDWQAATMNSVQSHLMDRAADILEHVDFTPAALRADLADGQISTGLLYSAAEMISHAADLCSDSAGLVHDNERRWRTFPTVSARSSPAKTARNSKRAEPPGPKVRPRPGSQSRTGPLGRRTFRQSDANHD
jgi:hypothetical protein